MQTAKNAHKYTSCDKQGMHEGELCTMVCMQAQCISNSLCCCVCIQQQHNKHVIKSLKSIIQQAESQSDQFKSTNYNIDVIFDIVANHQKNTLERFHQEKKELMDILDETEKAIGQYYQQVLEQVRNKNIDPKTEIYNSISIITCGGQAKQSREELVKIFKFLNEIKNKDESIPVTELDLIDNLHTSNDNLRNLIIAGVNKAKVQLKKQSSLVEQKIKQSNMFRKNVQLKFSPFLKHENVEILNPYAAKSVKTSAYKFALLNPCIDHEARNQSFAFTIGECSSNWVAVGVCHKNIVISRNYSFIPASLEHGAYLISSNGGVWSNHSSQFNNKIKSFKFTKGDEINIKVNSKEKLITFTKKTDSFEMPFENIEGQSLHPCVLFYYIGDLISTQSAKIRQYP